MWRQEDSKYGEILRLTPIQALLVVALQVRPGVVGMLPLPAWNCSHI
jgi:hypothetical protein